MSTFIAHNNPTESGCTAINDAFYPDIALDDFRLIMRVDQTVTNARTHHALLIAIIDINKELHLWKTNTHADTLAQVPSPNYGDKTELEHCYYNAIYHHAKAQLIESYRDFDSTKSGHEKADQLDSRIDDHKRQSRYAIRKILSKPNNTVELI